jgi:hypothetical protein
MLVSFDPRRSLHAASRQADVADSLAAWYRDVSGGTLKTKEGAWSVSVTGVTLDPQQLGRAGAGRQPAGCHGTALGVGAYRARARDGDQLRDQRRPPGAAFRGDQEDRG